MLENLILLLRRLNVFSVCLLFLSDFQINKSSRLQQKQQQHTYTINFSSHRHTPSSSYFHFFYYFDVVPIILFHLLFQCKRFAMKINRSVHFADWLIYGYVCNRCDVWLVSTSSNWVPFSAMIQLKSDWIYPVHRMRHHRYICYRKRYVDREYIFLVNAWYKKG